MAAARTYVDFVPSHDLVEETKKQILVLNLPGFRKEHLRVQIDNYGRLRVSGERPLEADEGGNQWSRFRKDFQVPDGCDAGAISARFEKDGVLQITMPMLSPADLPQGDIHDAEAARHAAAAATAEEKKKKKKKKKKKRHEKEDARKEEQGSGDGDGRGHHQAVEASSGAGRSSAYGFARNGSGVVRSLLIAVALALVGAAGLYARYRLMNSSGETAPADDATVGLSDY